MCDLFLSSRYLLIHVMSPAYVTVLAVFKVDALTDIQRSVLKGILNPVKLTLEINTCQATHITFKFSY